MSSSSHISLLMQVFGVFKILSSHSALLPCSLVFDFTSWSPPLFYLHSSQSYISIIFAHFDHFIMAAKREGLSFPRVLLGMVTNGILLSFWNRNVQMCSNEDSDHNWIPYIAVISPRQLNVQDAKCIWKAVCNLLVLHWFVTKAISVLCLTILGRWAILVGFLEIGCSENIWNRVSCVSKDRKVRC